MEHSLNPIEIRILGVLAEKQMTTPDYYPLTLNALITGCNQKTNRNPVMDLDTETVSAALDQLRRQRLVFQVKTHGSRTLKYEHHLQSLADFSKSELAVLSMLLLRGPQTPGELRSRTARLCEFKAVAAVEHILKRLQTHAGGSFAQRLPRQPGRREHRYAHRLGEIYDMNQEPVGEERQEVFATKESQDTAVGAMGPSSAATADAERLQMLERQLEAVVVRLDTLVEDFTRFKQEFE